MVLSPRYESSLFVTRRSSSLRTESYSLRTKHLHYESLSFVANRRLRHIAIVRRYVLLADRYVSILFVTYRSPFVTLRPLRIDRYVPIVTYRSFRVDSVLRRCEPLRMPGRVWEPSGHVEFFSNYADAKTP